jgi:hypothetical protein
VAAAASVLPDELVVKLLAQQVGLHRLHHVAVVLALPAEDQPDYHGAARESPAGPVARQSDAVGHAAGGLEDVGAIDLEGIQQARHHRLRAAGAGLLVFRCQLPGSLGDLFPVLLGHHSSCAVARRVAKTA